MTNTLPINNYLPEILESIANNPVTLVKAETGSGKSVYTLKAIAESGLSVFASVPTRLSASSLCDFVKTLNPNLSVGYAAEGTSVYDYKTKIVYATSGHVRRKMLGCFSSRHVQRHGLKFTDVLVLDETHTKSSDVTVCVSLWMEARRLGYKVPKLLLLSATPAELFVDPEPYIVEVPVPTPFPVEILYSPADYNVIDHAFETGLECYYNLRATGDILIFVSGSKDCDDLVSKFKEKDPNINALPAYSTLESDELKKIYVSEPDVRKIVVATNIAESSITIPNLEFVIDTMTCKEAVSSFSGAIRLEENLITKDSAKQRSGRVGRTGPGTCIRLISESNYEDLDDHCVAEIERIPLHNIVMEFFQAGIDPVETIHGIETRKVTDSINLLTKLGMLELEDACIPTVTKMGDYAPSVPLGVRNAAFIWKWVEAGYPLYPGVVIACLIDVHNNGYFHMPRRKRNQSPALHQEICKKHVETYYSDWIGESSLETYLNMWEEFTTKVGRSLFRLTNDPYSYSYKHWCRQKSINYKQLSELVLSISQTYKVCRYKFRGKTNVNVGKFDATANYTLSKSILKDIYLDRVVVKSTRWNTMIDNSFYPYWFDNRKVIAKMEKDLPRKAYMLALHEIKMGINNKTFIDLFVPDDEVQTQVLQQLESEE